MYEENILINKFWDSLICVCISLQIPDSKAPLPVKPSVLTPPTSSHRPSSPSSSSGLTPSPELRHSPLTPPTLEELRNQLRDLRSSVELLKSQHRYVIYIVRTWMCVVRKRAYQSHDPDVFMCFRQEMKQLSNTLDEEKRIRIGLQVRSRTIFAHLLYCSDTNSSRIPSSLNRLTSWTTFWHVQPFSSDCADFRNVKRFMINTKISNNHNKQTYQLRPRGNWW